MKVLEILKQLEATNSNNEKITILKENKDNEDLKRFFEMSLNPTLIFWIRKIPGYTVSNSTTTLKDGMTALYDLSERRYTGYAGIDYLASVLGSVHKDDAKVLERIIKKDPACGVSISTVNKVWKKLVKKWPCMLCERYNQKNLDRIWFPALIQEKSDGMRINIVVEDDQVQYMTRNGRSVSINSPDLDKIFVELAKYFDKFEAVVFDGEALVYEDDGSLMERKKGNGILNKAVRGTIKDDEASKIRFNLWDVIEKCWFDEGKDNTEYGKRFDSISDSVKALKSNIDTERIDIIHTEEVKSIDDAKDFYKRMLEAGKEGAVIKNIDSRWEDKRSKFQVKMKVENTCELKIIDAYSHKKDPNLIGGLVCESSCGKLHVNVGSGLKDSDRECKYSDFIGKIAAIKFNEVITSDDRKDTKSLFLPIYTSIREDKSEADSLKEIEAM